MGAFHSHAPQWPVFLNEDGGVGQRPERLSLCGSVWECLFYDLAGAVGVPAAPHGFHVWTGASDGHV